MISDRALDRLSAMFRGPDVAGTRYELLSLLGRGGMGAVYLARDSALDREVALKVVDRPSADEETLDRLAREARILARLEHPGIVPVHDFGQLPDGRLFYAMKRVRGDRLDRWIAAGHDLGDRLGVFLRVCDAVAFAHAHGVIHRDVKPENIMVAEFGEVLVLDWGVATDVCGHPSGPGIRDSERTRIVGTPEYMAPEQARGDAGVDHRADVFALGTLLDAMARKARSADPAARYQDVQTLTADVRRFLAGRAVDAHREHLLDRFVRVGTRHRVPILLIMTYLLARVLMLWLFRA
jgi:serine/threonine protein kinase